MKMDIQNQEKIESVISQYFVSHKFIKQEQTNQRKQCLIIYNAFTPSQKNHFWNDISSQTDVTKETLQRYFFFIYSKPAYSGSVETIRDAVMFQAGRYNVSDATINSALQQIWISVKKLSDEQDVHPGSVHQMIYEILKTKQILMQTPNQSILLKQVTIYSVSPKKKMDDCLDDNIDEMVQALKGIFDGL